MKVKILKSFSRILAVMIFSMAILVVKSGGASAATFNVVGGIDGLTANGSCTLSEAMTNIQDNSQTYSECADPTDAVAQTINLPADTITLTADLPILTQPTSVIGQGRDQSIIDGANHANLFRVALGSNTDPQTLTFSGFTARDIDQVNSNNCITVGNTWQLDVAHIINVTDVDLHNCGTYGIGLGAHGSIGNISGVNISGTLSSTFTVGVLSLYPRNVSVSNSSITGRSIGVYYALSGNSVVDTAEYTLRNTTLTSNAIGLLFATMAGSQDPLKTINATMENNTIVSNSNNGTDQFSSSVHSGGAVFATGSIQAKVNASLKNNIIANNLFQGSKYNCFTGTGQYSPNVTMTTTNNLSDDTCDGRLGGDDFINVPDVANKVDVLSDNGGGVKTMALLIGSTAIDQGVTIGGITTDARGVTRPQNAVYDVGAYEKTAETTNDPDPEPEDPDDPGPPGGSTAGDTTTPSTTTPAPPRTGKLIGAFLASVSVVALIFLGSREVIEGRVRVGKSDK